MKLNKIMFNSVGVVTALIAGSSMAGEIGNITGDSITAPPAPIQSSGGGILAGTGIEGSLSAGYDSTYVFRGQDTGDNLAWSALELRKDLGNGVAFNVGAWYASLIEDSFNELDLYAGIEKSFGPVTLGLGYTYYWFGQTGGYTQEVGASAKYTLPFAPIDLKLSYFYDLEEANDGSYLNLQATYQYALSENVGIEVGASVAYGFDYYVLGDDWYDANVRLGLPVKLTDSATLTPYIALSVPLDGAESFNGNDKDILYGGAAISVSF